MEEPGYDDVQYASLCTDVVNGFYGYLGGKFGAVGSLVGAFAGSLVGESICNVDYSNLFDSGNNTNLNPNTPASPGWYDNGISCVPDQPVFPAGTLPSLNVYNDYGNFDYYMSPGEYAGSDPWGYLNTYWI